MSGEKAPSQEDVRLIFKETYLLFLEAQEMKTDNDFQDLIRKSHDLKNKYPFKLCETIILELWNIVDGYSKEIEHG